MPKNQEPEPKLIVKKSINVEGSQFQTTNQALRELAKKLIATEDPATKQALQDQISQEIATVTPAESKAVVDYLSIFAFSDKTTNEMLFALNSPTIVVQGAPDPHPITDKTLVVIGEKAAGHFMRPVLLKDNAGNVMVSTIWAKRPLVGDNNMQDSVRAGDFSLVEQDFDDYLALNRFYITFLKNAELMNPELKGQILSEYKIA